MEAEGLKLDPGLHQYAVLLIGVVGHEQPDFPFKSVRGPLAQGSTAAVRMPSDEVLCKIIAVEGT